MFTQNFRRYAIIILIVSNESKILATIKSRCILVKFNVLLNSEIKEIRPDLSDDLIKILDGSLQNVDNIINKQEQYKELKNIVQSIKNNSLAELFNKSELLYNSKDDIISMLEFLNTIFINNEWINCVEIVEKTKRKILLNNNYDMCIDYFLMHVWEEINEKNYRG